MKKLFFIIFNFAILILLFSILSKYSFATCIDSDSSNYPTINYNQQGTAISGADSLADYCTANVLVEYYCNSANEARVFNTIYSCQDGCSDGVCKEVVENPPKSPFSEPSSGISGPVSKGQSRSESASENSAPSPNGDSSNLPAPDNNPVKNELSPKESNDVKSLFGNVVKLNSGPGLIIILFVLVLVLLYLVREKLGKKF